MRRIKNCIWFFLIAWLAGIAGIGTSQTAVAWHPTLQEARQASAASSKSLLVFFHATNGTASAQLKRLLHESAACEIISAKYEALQLNLDESANRELAKQMGVFKAGVLVVYSPTGRPVAKSQELQSLEELLGFLRQGAGIASPPPKSSSESGAKAEHYQKGALVTGPISVASYLDKPVRICNLPKDKKYILVAEGVCSLWKVQQNYGADALFRYQSPKAPGQVEPMDLLRLQNPDVSMYELVQKTQGATPALQPSHCYEAVLSGEGQALSVYVNDKDYKDNSGSLKVTLYEAVTGAL